MTAKRMPTAPLPNRDDHSGRLFVVGTPIGNLEDMTLRGLRILKEADGILAEDTRHTRKLLSYYDIHTPLISYYKETEKKKAPEIVSQLESGKKFAIVSDAGMPGVSDPGTHLVRLARERGIPVEVIPGASAVLTALVGSGISTEKFSFFGFLDAKPGERRRMLETLKNRQETMVFFVPPHKLSDVLHDFLRVWGDRHAVLCREMTKIHESYWAGPVSEMLETAEHTARGEMTLVVEGGKQIEPEPVSESMEDALARLQSEGLGLNQAVARVARLQGLPREVVYARAHAIRPKKSN